MKTESLSAIKSEIKNLPEKELREIIVRLAKYKVENKELVNYLLFHLYDQENYIQLVQNEIDEQFKALNKSRTYLAKKTIRKALKTTQKHIKFAAKKEVEITLLIHFCKKLRKSDVMLRRGTVLGNLYMRQFQRIEKILESLHEDMQLDFEQDIDILRK